MADPSIRSPSGADCKPAAAAVSPARRSVASATRAIDSVGRGQPANSARRSRVPSASSGAHTAVSGTRAPALVAVATASRSRPARPGRRARGADRARRPGDRRRCPRSAPAGRSRRPWRCWVRAARCPPVVLLPLATSPSHRDGPPRPGSPWSNARPTSPSISTTPSSAAGRPATSSPTGGPGPMRSPATDRSRGPRGSAPSALAGLSRRECSAPPGCTPPSPPARRSPRNRPASSGDKTSVGFAERLRRFPPS
jgi:hypothetical protein